MLPVTAWASTAMTCGVVGTCGDPADLVATLFGEPEVAVRAGRDPDGMLPAVGMANSVTMPAVVIRPILLHRFSVNQRLPSGPAVIPWAAVGRRGSGTR